MQSSPFSHHFSLSDPNILLSFFLNTLNLCKGKGKVVPMLLTEHDAMKAYCGVEV
jgi:hypothetical protein